METAVTVKGNDITNGAVLPSEDVNRPGKSSEDEELDLLPLLPPDLHLLRVLGSSTMGL
jgi:hypothetical protein